MCTYLTTAAVQYTTVSGHHLSSLFIFAVPLLRWGFYRARYTWQLWPMLSIAAFGVIATSGGLQLSMNKGDFYAPMAALVMAVSSFVWSVLLERSQPRRAYARHFSFVRSQLKSLEADWSALLLLRRLPDDSMAGGWRSNRRLRINQYYEPRTAVAWLLLNLDRLIEVRGLLAKLSPRSSGPCAIPSQFSWS